MGTARELAGAGIIAAGLAINGLFIGGGFARLRTGDRCVTVKGISEREVRADQAQGISEASQIVKTVRVVSTIDYALDN